jgi:hypothetical protein
VHLQQDMKYSCWISLCISAGSSVRLLRCRLLHAIEATDSTYCKTANTAMLPGCHYTNDTGPQSADAGKVQHISCMLQGDVTCWVGPTG